MDLRDFRLLSGDQDAFASSAFIPLSKEIIGNEIGMLSLICVFGPIVWSPMAPWHPHEGYRPRSGRTLHVCSEMTTAVSSFMVHTEVIYSTLGLFTVSENQIKKQTLRKTKLGLGSLIRLLTADFFFLFCFALSVFKKQ